MTKALISGATGTIGRALEARLGFESVVVSRNPEAARKVFARSEALGWDGMSDLPSRALEGVDTVFHLAGEPVAEGRWTSAKRARIRDSRVDGTRAVVRSIAARPSGSRPRVLVSASAVGFYGTRGDEVLTEASAVGEGFLPDVCKAWEDEARLAEQAGVRVVMLRIGIVLAREGGALARMLPMFKLGVAGKLGRGDQWMPWIHVEDVVGLFAHAARTDALSGPVNAVAPAPVTNADFTRGLARALKRPAIFAAPAPMLRLALGEMASVVLASQRVVPSLAVASGFAFAFPSLDDALADLVGTSPQPAVA
jgi:uncharacterized protein (TIGR01777 family)